MAIAEPIAQGVSLLDRGESRMEYEIRDEPQGLADIPDGDRDGGLRTAGSAFKHPASEQDRDNERNPALEQMGELA